MNFCCPERVVRPACLVASGPSQPGRAGRTCNLHLTRALGRRRSHAPPSQRHHRRSTSTGGAPVSANGQVVTQSDVARAAGVSRSLVSLALSGSPKVAPDTRERIHRVAADLGYRVNVAASSLARRRSSIIGVVLPNLRNAFFERLARCLGEAASARGMTLFITVGSEQPTVLHQAIESLLGVRVAGIVLVSPWLPDEDLLAIAEEVPTCLVGRRSPGGKVDAVHIDEPAAARLVVDHLVGRGARTIAYIGPSTTDEASRREREQALSQAVASTRSQVGATMSVYECGRDAGPAVRAALSDQGNGSGPLGLVMHNDGFAIDAVPVLREAARDRGARVLLVSYDNTYLAEREEFSLTSVSQSDERMAAQAVELVSQRADTARNDAARSVVLAPTLVERTSSLGRRA
ncbi:LacI family transcriptional regulator [Actinomyces sp. 2119]|nr:LacI family transcriptional regulator [Actinomyces sp. 2119]